uniref:Sister chromatid cohesion protein PDS5 homolog A n=1 Tax=Kalanchoe fedtschenkoi TaxID=63787 RepID=A0A7N0TLY4_KALFE
MGPKDIYEIGKKLSKLTRPSKDFLVKTLGKTAKALSELNQNPAMEPAIKPISTYLFVHGLVQNKDRDIKLLVAICITEIIRILAPEPPFSDHDFRDVFQLIISTFAELADTQSPYFCKRVKILETVAELKCCLLMLDIGCEDLVVEMFTIFFSVIRENHQRSLTDAFVTIMTLILKETVAPSLLITILENLLKEGKGRPHPQSQLAITVLEASSEFVMPPLSVFLTTCILDRDSIQSELKEFHHDIIYKVYQCAPQMLLSVIPILSHELLVDRVDIRRKAVKFVGKLLSLPQSRIAQEYSPLFADFLKKFSDVSAEVRVSSVQCVKSYYLSNPHGSEADNLLSALSDRLLDFDDSVRSHAVVVVCDLAISNLKTFPAELIFEATKRLRDKKISVRKKTLQKLLELYMEYCNKCSEGLMPITDHFEQIPCKILKLSFEKDCKEFRPHNMELLLAEELFPQSLSVKERTRHWIAMFSRFDFLHLKALNAILLQKARFQKEMQNYVSFHKKKKAIISEGNKFNNASAARLAAFFLDTATAEECIYNLNQTGDDKVLDGLGLLLEEHDFMKARLVRDNFLKLVAKHPHYDFLQLLSTKCMCNIFSSENVSSILHLLTGGRYADEHDKDSCINLLLVIISSFPILARDSEKMFERLLLEEDNIFNAKLIQVLVKAGTYLSIKLCDIYPSLERVCLEGTRAQSKVAVSAISALSSSSEQFVFSELAKALVDSLKIGHNIPTILQALGCLAQHSTRAYDSFRSEVTTYIEETIFQTSDVESSDEVSSQEVSQPSDCCKLKIYALKTLVKSFLPHNKSNINLDIAELIEILSKLLQKGSTLLDHSDDESKADISWMRLAAGKAVLRLSKRWDSCIPYHVFDKTIMLAKDSSTFVQNLFVDKIHKFLIRHVVPSRYGCAFAMAAPACLHDLQDNLCDFVAEFIREYSREFQSRQSPSSQGSVVDNPAYVVVFLVHVLAHSTGFPSKDCHAEVSYVQHFSPLFFMLLALVNDKILGGDRDLADDIVSSLLCIFRAIKKAEDAVDASITYRLHILADVGIMTVNAIYHDRVSALRAKRLVLLPLSLFSVNSNCLLASVMPETFLRNILHVFKSLITTPLIGVPPKHGRKRKDDSSQSESVKHCILSAASQMQVEQATQRTKETHSSKLNEKVFQQSVKNNFNGQNTVSHSAFGSDEARICYRPTAEDDHGVSEKQEPLPGIERRLSSCNSVNMKQLDEPQLPTKKLAKSKNALVTVGMETAYSSITAVDDRLPTRSVDRLDSKSNFHKDKLQMESLITPVVHGDSQYLSAPHGPGKTVETFGRDMTNKRKESSSNEKVIYSNKLIRRPEKKLKDKNISSSTLTKVAVMEDSKNLKDREVSTGSFTKMEDAIAHRTRRRKL